MPLFEPGDRHTFKARSIEDDCRDCGERYAHPSHFGIGWTGGKHRMNADRWRKIVEEMTAILEDWEDGNADAETTCNKLSDYLDSKEVA